MKRVRRLRRSELPLQTLALARYLVGKTLVHETPKGRLSGRIVETEAYPIGDAAAHSYRGKTLRNQSLFLRRGHAYVYFIYGVWFALNVSAEKAGMGAGVLLRAMEPLQGLDLMRKQRPQVEDHRLARGPGCLATAMGINRRLDGLDLCAPGPLWLGTPVQKTRAIGTSIRIGITKEAHRPYRFFERGNPCVSGPAHLNRF